MRRRAWAQSPRAANHPKIVTIRALYRDPMPLRGHTIHEVRGEVAIGPSIYGVHVIDGSLCSRVYGMSSMLPLHMYIVWIM